MRRRLIAALTGVAVATLVLYAVPRSLFLAEMVRDREELGLARTADLAAEALDRRHGFEPPILRLLEMRARQMGLSLRRLHRAARVARTIADLDGAELVGPDHVGEALGHRPKEAAA